METAIWHIDNRLLIFSKCLQTIDKRMENILFFASFVVAKYYKINKHFVILSQKR